MTHFTLFTAGAGSQRININITSQVSLAWGCAIFLCVCACVWMTDGPRRHTWLTACEPFACPWISICLAPVALLSVSLPVCACVPVRPPAWRVHYV